MTVVALIAEQADGASLLHQRGELVHFLPRLQLLQMRRIDLLKRGVVAAARGLPSFLGRAKGLQMNIGNAALIERGCKLVLGKAGPSRRGDGAYIDQELDACALQLVQHRLLRRLLVADGEELAAFCHWFTSLVRSAPSPPPAHAPCPRG